MCWYGDKIVCRGILGLNGKDLQREKYVIRIWEGIYVKKKTKLTFSKSVDITPEVISSLLAVDQLAQPSDHAIALLHAIVSLVRQIHLSSALNTFRYAIRQQSLCNDKYYFWNQN